MTKQYIDKEAMKIIRERIWVICKSKGIVLEDLVDRTGFSYSQISRIVRGKNNTSVSNIIAIAKALAVQPNEIFDFEITIPNHPPLRKDRKAKK